MKRIAYLVLNRINKKIKKRTTGYSNARFVYLSMDCEFGLLVTVD